MKTAREKVLVAMSGGVDSSVTALLLCDDGYAAMGITMRLLDGAQACASDDNCTMAQQVCEALGILHSVCDLRAMFEKCVIGPFCTSYLEGRTPNPCIECNRYLKFAALQEERRERSYDYVATGHYARRIFNGETGRYELHRAIDAAKDQTYFLYHLDQDTLAHMLFPLGGLTKPEVRAIAEEHGLANAKRSESQDICFVPGGDYAAFIAERCGRPSQPGEIVNRAGDVLGSHHGLVHYTVGQRKGIGVAAREPLYVFAKDAASNRLIVDTDENTLVEDIVVHDVNFIALPSLEAPGHFTCKTHYRQRPIGATVEQTGDAEIRVAFDEPQRACAPGQAAVVYDGDNVVCGGTIE